MRVPAHLRVDGTRILSAEDFEKIKQLKQQVADGETFFFHFWLSLVLHAG